MFVADVSHGVTPIRWRESVLSGPTDGWLFERPKCPDALTAFGVIDEQLAVHYYDCRGR